MDDSWMQTAGRASLFVFAALVGISLISMMVRGALGRRETVAGRDALLRRGSALLRILVEYVGNTGPEEAAPAGEQERRRNWQARALMEVIKREMTQRAATPSETEAFLEELRRAMQIEGPGPG